MSNLKEVTKEYLNKKFGSHRIRVELIDAKYVVVLDNDEIRQSDSDTILDVDGIKKAFIFPKVHYSPQFYWYDAYMSPFIINENLEISEVIVILDEWKIEIIGQPLDRTPHSNFIRIKNEKIGFEHSMDYCIDDFPLYYRLMLSISASYSKTEAMLRIEVFNSNRTIVRLENTVQNLEADQRIKNVIIEGYKEVVNKIAGLVIKKDN